MATAFGARSNVETGQPEQELGPRELRQRNLIIILIAFDRGENPRGQKWRWSEDCFRLGESGPDVGGGKETRVADLGESGRQPVLQEPPNELDGVQGSRPWTSGLEDHGVIVEVQQAGVADCDAVSVTTQVSIDLLSTAKGSLGIDDPALLVELGPLSPPSSVIPFAGQEASSAQAFEAVEKLSTKERAQDMNREEKVLGCGHPRTVLGQSAPGDDAVGVGVELEIAGPGVEHGSDSEQRGAAPPLRVAAEREQASRSGFEQEVKHRLGMASGQVAQLGREREDDMEVVDGQDPVEPLGHPARAAERLALRTVAIATGVVDRVLVTTGSAMEEMAAQEGGSARDQVARQALVQRVGSVQLPKIVEVPTEHVGDLEPRLSVRLRAR